MKKATRYLLVLGLGALALAAAPALAFHDGGVAHCNGCHTMHAGPSNPADNPNGNEFLLKESTPTDTCLRCHDDRLGNVFGGGDSDDPLNPGTLYGGGQFVFLLEDNINDGHNGASNPILGEKAGHSIISEDKGLAADSVNSTAPGGTYLSSYLHCTSCHDPHGQGGHFRLLYGNDGNPNVDSTSQAAGYPYDFTAAPPDAVGIPVFGGGESNSNHTAYNAGMSDWCATCHGDYHTGGGASGFKHPTGEPLGSTIAANYNLYEGTGTYTGDGTDAYLAMVPFEDPTVTTDYVGAASGTSQVMCLTCHRAHASSAPQAGRWDFNITIWDEEGVESGSYVIPNPYAATAGGHQRSLCNKCHAKDPVL
ncbi:MAG: cytochrome c [Acidobacteriota bacterium]